MNPPGTWLRLIHATTHAPIAAKVSWESAMIPAEPVTTPSPITAMIAVMALMPRNTK